MIGTTGQPIYLPTPQTGTDQITHPSVVWVPDGWNGHPYWMAATPYDGKNAQYENPCIYFSDDGVKWSPIDGNPIVGAPPNGFNADPTLALDGDTMVCLWRKSVARTYETLQTAISTDGQTWTPGPDAYNGNQFTEHVSPTLIRRDDHWLLFSVRRVVGGMNVVRRFASADIAGPWVEQECEGITAPPGREPWHLWVGVGDDGWHAILNDTEYDRNGGNGNLYHSHSIDGHAWTEPAVCLPTRGQWHDTLYQACAVWRCGGLDVWYSAATPSWRIGLTRLTPPGAKLSIGVLASSGPIVPAGLGTYEEEVLADSPLLYVPALDTSGALTDSSGNGRDLTASGLVYNLSTAIPALVGNSPGWNNFADVASTAIGAWGDVTDWTLEIWTKYHYGTNYDGAVFGFYESTDTLGTYLGYTDTGVVSFRVNNTTNDFEGVVSSPSPTNIRDGSWHHFVGVKDGASARAYIDGVQIGSTATITGTPRKPYSGGTHTFYVGDGPNQSRTWLGSSCAIAFYGTALSATRISAHYTAGLVAP